MSEKNYNTLSPNFDKSIKIEFTGEKVTSDAGTIMLAEFDNKLGLINNIANKLHDPRNPDLIIHTMESLLKQRLFTIAAGYEDGDDADDLRHDPGVKAAIGKKEVEEILASQPTISRLENILLHSDKNLDVIKVSNLDIAIQHYKLLGRKYIYLDIDSYESPVHGDQEGAAYNAYYGSRCYHPLVLHDGYGFKLKVELRAGNEYTKTGAVAFLEPVLKRLREEGFKYIHLTADSGFADPDIFDLCESYEIFYYIRLKSNPVLQRKTNHLLTRPRGRPAKGILVRYGSFHYKAETWDCYRRVVAKAMHHPGQLFAEIFFIVTNSPAANKQAFKRYGQRRGRAEQRNDEGKNMMFSVRLSCHDEKANDVRLQLYTLAYNFMILFRHHALSGDARKWTLETIRLRLIKIGARITKGANYKWFHFSAGPWRRRLISGIFKRIQLLPQPCW